MRLLKTLKKYTNSNNMKTFVILGMHRSATSLVAKGLNTIVHLGDEENMLPSAPDNPEGFYENTRFLELNDEILHKAGGNWLEPPAEEKIIEQMPFFRSRIETLIKEESAGHSIWGWKDPRTSLTIRLFHPYLTNPHYIACFRTPEDVAKSLKTRNGYSLFKGINCTLEYNHRIIKFLSEVHLNPKNH